MLRRDLLKASGLALAGAFVAVAPAIVTSARAQARTTIRLSIGAPESQGGEILGLRAIKQYAEFRSGGAIEIRLFFNTLGGSLQLTEMVKNGTLDMALTDDSVLGSFHAPMQVFQIPYLFASSPVAWEFMGSPFMREMTESMRTAIGVRTLAFSENGFRNITNNVREVRGPGDMRGLKMRTMQSQVYVSFMRSLGAAATPIAYPELIASLRQNVVDGQENAASTIMDARLFEVQRFMTLNEHIYGMHLIITNDRWFSALPIEHRQILMDAARLHAQIANGKKALDNVAAVDQIRQSGVRVYIPTSAERDAWRETTQGAVREYIASQVGGPDLVTRVVAEAEAARRRVYGV
jgi:C4-dicarboxylate-binding protein DctP